MFGRVLMPLLYNSEHVSLYRIIWWSKYWKLFWKIVLKYRIKMFFLLKMHANNRHLKLNFCWGVTRSFLGDFQKNHSAKRIQWLLLSQITGATVFYWKIICIVCWNRLKSYSRGAMFSNVWLAFYECISPVKVFFVFFVISSVIRQKCESQNGCFKKTKCAKFSEKQTFLTHWYAHVRVCIRG